VIGAASIAQEAVLPAFEQAENSQLAALVSGEERKGEEHDRCLSGGEIDAVYIALPKSTGPQVR